MAPLQLLTSPWLEAFKTFARSIRRSALLVSPFVTAGSIDRLTPILRRDKPVDIEILTNMDVNSLLQGASDPRAIADFSSALPTVTVRHLPGLHAKVYIADETTAIVTSANLTVGGLTRNYEYGVQITDVAIVRRIAEDLRSYGQLGIEVSLPELYQLARVSEALREQQSQLVRSANTALREEFQRQISSAQESLRQLRARPGETTNGIFARTILYLLRSGPLSTQQMHPLIQTVHPDLCDDTIDRVINGVHFGKKWKHRVRSAQQNLKSRGRVRFDGQVWSLVH